MRADVVVLPSHLKPGQLEGRVVVVLDVLRATTSMIAALAWGVREIRIFPDTDTARQAARQSPGALLCGEERCLKPPDFDLGNSPGDFNSEHAGQTLFMRTTNGTRAILVARGADRVVVGGLINATAVANYLRRLDSDVILLCAGTGGEVAMEDVIGAGAILNALGADVKLESKGAQLATSNFRSASKVGLPHVLRQSTGGINIIRAGLERDIDYAAQLDSHSVIGVALSGEPIKVVRETSMG